MVQLLNNEIEKNGAVFNIWFKHNYIHKIYMEKNEYNSKSMADFIVYETLTDLGKSDQRF